MHELLLIEESKYLIWLDSDLIILNPYLTISKIISKYDNYDMIFSSDPNMNNGLVNIFYDINKDEPNNASTNSIYGIISLLKNNPSMTIKLTGYSDRTGSESTNKYLSERRVKKIYDVILLGGISPERIKIIGEGVDNSILSNSKTALQLARRVSVIIE